MRNAQIRPLPDIRAVHPRVPRLDPRRADAVRRADRRARRRRARGGALRARLRVRGRERGHAEREARARPDVRAVHPAVCGRDRAGL